MSIQTQITKIIARQMPENTLVIRSNYEPPRTRQERRRRKKEGESGQAATKHTEKPA